ncbi:hypothetical protein AgCh_039207 [Apium graveolens]
MPPGRSKRRYSLPRKQELPINDTSAFVAEREFINDSAGKNLQVSRRITRSNVLSQQVESTAQPIGKSFKEYHQSIQKKWNSKNGSVSTMRHHIRRGMELSSSTGQIETWRQNHFDENGWTGPEFENLYTSQPTYQEMVEQLTEAKSLLTQVVDILRKNNLMPQSAKSPTNDVSDGHMENSG